MGVASFALLRVVARAALGVSGAMVEGNFDGRLASAEWRDLVAETGASARVIELRAPPELLAERILARDASGQRHPGHRVVLPDSDRTPPLVIGAPTLVLDASRSAEEIAGEAIAWLARRVG